MLQAMPELVKQYAQILVRQHAEVVAADGRKIAMEDGDRQGRPTFCIDMVVAHGVGHGIVGCVVAMKEVDVDKADDLIVFADFQ